jgi:hypothetical protein
MPCPRRSAGGSSAARRTRRGSTSIPSSGRRTSCESVRYQSGHALISRQLHTPHHASTSRIYVDTRLHLMLDLRFNRPFFDRGHFPPTIQNNSQIVALPNPWLNRPNSAPFDQRTLCRLPAFIPPRCRASHFSLISHCAPTFQRLSHVSPCCPSSDIPTA